MMFMRRGRRNTLPTPVIDVSELRASRGQSAESSPPPSYQSRTSSARKSPEYRSFLRKYEDLENTVDTFGTRDLVYYFREVASRNGFKYVIANIQKDMAIMKRLRENYDTREILVMIEFLYESEQDYLRKDTLSPNVLASGWCNTIYADMLLWVEDKYTPASKRPAVKQSSDQTAREWKKTSDSGSVTIGGKF